MAKTLLYQRKGYAAPVHRNEQVVGPGNLTKIASSKRYARATGSLAASGETSPTTTRTVQVTQRVTQGLSNKEVSNNNNFSTSEVETLRADVEQLKAQVRRAEIDKQAEIGKRVAVAAEKVVLAKQIEDLKYQLEDALKAKGIQEGQNNSLRISQKAQLTFQTDLNCVRAELAKVKKDLEITKKESDEQKKKIDSYEQSLRDRELECMELALQLEQHQNQHLSDSGVEPLYERISELEKVTSKLQAERTQLQQDLRSVRQKSVDEVVSAHQKLNALQELVFTLQAENQTLEEQNKTIQQEINDVCMQVMEKEQEIEKLTNEKKEVEELRQFEQEELKELMCHCEEVEADVAQLDLVVGEKKSEIEILDKHNELLVNQLMELGFGVEVTETGELQFVEFG